MDDFLLRELLVNSTGPQLPMVNKSHLRGYLVNIRADGTVALQFDSPSSSAFDSLMVSSRSMLNRLIEDEEAFSKKRAPLPLDPNEIYLATYGPRPVFYRAKYIPDEKTPPGKAPLRFIDYGNEDIERVESIVLARSVHEVLALTPPQCIEAKLVNIESLDVDGAYSLISDATPVVVRTMSPAEGSELVKVQILMDVRDERGLIKEQHLCFSTRLIEKGLATGTKNPVNTHSGIQADFSQLEHIEMKNSTNWSLEAPSSLATVYTPTVLHCDQVIYFRVHHVPENEDFVQTVTAERPIRQKLSSSRLFTIQPVGGEDVVLEISRLILTHVKQPWYRCFKKDFNLNSFHKGWFYPYYNNEKAKFYRARLDRATGIEGNLARVLLIDLGTYIDRVDLTELEMSLPLTVCSIGPQAARVHHVRIQNNSYFSSANPAGWREKICAFRKMHKGKICTAKITSVSHDVNGLPCLALDDMKVVEQTPGNPA